MKRINGLVVLAFAVSLIQGLKPDIGATLNAQGEGLEEKARNLHAFMPKPTGPGFQDKGISADPEFNQMERFGIPDINNPITPELTDLNFHLAIQGEQYTAVLFYSQKMTDFEYFALHWEKAAMEMRESLRVFTAANITMTRFDVSEPEHQDIVEEYNIGKRTPEMKLFFNGTLLMPIDCPVGHHDIRQFIIAQTIPSVTYISHEHGMSKWKRRKVFNQANLKMLALFDSTQANADEFIQHYKNVAEKLKILIQFAYTDNADIFQKALKLDQPAQNNDMFLIRDFDDPKILPYFGELNADNMLEFVNLYNMPIMTNLGDSEEYKVRDFLSHETTFRMMFFFKTKELFEKYQSNLLTIGIENRHNCLIGYTIENKEDQLNFDYQFWGVPSDTPSVLYLHLRRDRKYIYSNEDAYELDTIRSFLHQIQTFQIQPKMREQVLSNQNKGSKSLVKVLTTSTIVRDILNAKHQDSLILFHTSSQSHRNINGYYMHVLEKIAKIYRREKNLLVSRIDMSKNDVLQMDELKDLPRFYYISSKLKQELVQSGGNEVRSNKMFSVVFNDADTDVNVTTLAEFVKTHGSLNLEIDTKVWTRLMKEEEQVLMSKEGQPVELTDEEEDTVENVAVLDNDINELVEEFMKSVNDHESPTEYTKDEL